MLKNRTFLGILCIGLAILLVFAISPLFNRVFDGKSEVVILRLPVLQGQQITPEMLSVVEVGSYNLPPNTITNTEQIVGRFAVSDLFAGSYVFPNMLTDRANTSDTMLRNLKEHEIAMSVTISSFASGFSGKLITGDIIRIVMVDTDRVAHLFDELQYVEVLTTTSGSGSDNIERAPATNADGEVDMPVTITVVLHDNLQILRLAECEHTSLHAIFISRDVEMKDEYIQRQLEIIEQIYADMESELDEFGGDFGG
jgi:pilus assembly protein CpaB